MSTTLWRKREESAVIIDDSGSAVICDHPRYYNDEGTVLNDAHFAIFPNKPKPWDLNLPWIPPLEQ